MDAEKLEAGKVKRVFSIVHIVLFVVIAALMIVLVLVLFYQWYARPTSSLMPLKELHAALV